MNQALLDWKADGQFYPFHQHSIFYRENQAREKPCLVCIHGFPASSWDWRALWPTLSSHFHVIAPDLIGFGFSDKPDNYSYSVMEQADLIESLLKSKGIDDYHILAHDFGVLIAQELLARQTNVISVRNGPDIASLFAMSGSVLPELSNPRLIQKLLISPLGPVITKLFSQQKFNKSLSRVFSPNTLPDEATLKSYWQLLQQKDGDKQLHKLNFFLKDRLLHGERWREAWQTASLPIRYVAGLDDPMYGKAGIEQLQALSAQQDIHAIANCGHFPHLESPHAIQALIEDFIAV